MKELRFMAINDNFITLLDDNKRSLALTCYEHTLHITTFLYYSYPLLLA